MTTVGGQSILSKGSCKQPPCSPQKLKKLNVWQTVASLVTAANATSSVLFRTGMHLTRHGQSGQPANISHPSAKLIRAAGKH
jgi:hypothetical protein